MKPLHYLSFFIFMLTFGFSGAFAQKAKVSSSLKQAKKEYEAMKYANVISLLDKIGAELPKDAGTTEMMANSYRKTQDYPNAAIWYEKLVKEPSAKPEWALAYAQVLANNQRYAEAQQWYENYLKLAGADRRAEDFAKSYQNLGSFMRNKSHWRVGYANINTAASEYAPVFYRNGLLFVSNRSVGNWSKRVFGWDQSPFSNLFVVEALSQIKIIDPDSLLKAFRADSAKVKLKIKANDDSTPATSNDNPVFAYNNSILNDTIGQLTGANELAAPLAGFVNSKYHEGPVAILPGGSMMFTRNNYFKGKASTSKDGLTKLKLFTALAPSLDQVFPFKYNSDEYSTGHPALNSTGTLLVFASDMPGGQGGVDLYYCTRASLKDEWSKPVNMGKAINTEGDELFPTLYQDSTLFFASNGHPGLGGLDIFQIALNGSEASGRAINLGAPVNSSVDDFSLVRNPEGNTGFFSSNRRGNDDIYAFEFEDYKVWLKGTLLNQATREPLPNTRINLNYKGQADMFYTDNKGNFEKQLPKETLVKVTINQPGFEAFVLDKSTIGLQNDTTLYQQISLKPLPAMDRPTSRTSPCDSLKKVLTGLKIDYRGNETAIGPKGMEVLNKVALLLKQYPALGVNIAGRNAKAGVLAGRNSTIRKFLLGRGIGESRLRTSNLNEGQNNSIELRILYQEKDLSTLDCTAFPQL